MIGGNITAVIQTKSTGGKNAIGEDTASWTDRGELIGFLDLSAGDSKRTVYSAKIQESTHIFICDYTELKGVTAENSRLVCKGSIYDILLIDNPMELDIQLEIYLKYAGGQGGGL